MRQKSYQAFLFDLNGTMIDDMNYHIRAWHSLLISFGADLTLSQMKQECYGKNNEMLERIFPGRFSDAEKEKIGSEKEAAYRKSFLPELKLIDGLSYFLESVHAAGIKTAIGSAAISLNIDFVLDGLNIRRFIDAVVSADDVANSKPHPETFLKCSEALSVKPEHCLVFEDAPKGVEAALNAGMDCMVITTMHAPEEFDVYKNVTGFIDTYNDDLLQRLLCLKETV
jgi:beta-phosphoglucomutase family hydrolase